MLWNKHDKRDSILMRVLIVIQCPQCKLHERICSSSCPLFIVYHSLSDIHIHNILLYYIYYTTSYKPDSLMLLRLFPGVSDVEKRHLHCRSSARSLYWLEIHFAAIFLKP